MGILYWENPKRLVLNAEFLRDPEDPPVRVPEPSERWVAKLHDGEHPTVELRHETHNRVNVKVIVSADGIIPAVKRNYGWTDPEKHGANIRISMNGTGFFTWKDWQNLHDAIGEALVELDMLLVQHRTPQEQREYRNYLRWNRYASGYMTWTEGEDE